MSPSSLICVFFDILRWEVMDPFQMLPEVVRPWPFLVLGPTALNSTPIVLVVGNLIWVAASYVSFDIVRSTETLGAGAALDSTVVGLLVLLLVLSARDGRQDQP